MVWPAAASDGVSVSLRQRNVTMLWFDASIKHVLKVTTFQFSVQAQLDR